MTNQAAQKRRWIISAIDKRSGQRRELYSVLANSLNKALIIGRYTMSKEWRQLEQKYSMRAELSPYQKLPQQEPKRAHHSYNTAS